MVVLCRCRKEWEEVGECGKEWYFFLSVGRSGKRGEEWVSVSRIDITTKRTEPKYAKF